MKRLLMLALVAGGLHLSLVGCKHHDPRPCPQPCPLPPQPAPYPGPGPGPGPAPGYVPGPLPKGPVGMPDLPPPAPVPSQSKSIDPYEAQKNMEWKPGGIAPSVRLYPPEVDDGTPPAKAAYVPPPEFGGYKQPPKVEENIKPMAPASSPLPVGIARFVLVRDHLANGQRPSLDDGLDWLQSQNYSTILCLHLPNVSTQADRKQVEKRGMKFISLEVSPVTLTQKHVDEFNRLVGDSSVLPLFVYDNDGSLAGAMWYLHYRTAELATDETARKHAHPLGLREDAVGTSQQMWQAAQKLLSESVR